MFRIIREYIKKNDLYYEIFVIIGIILVITSIVFSKHINSVITFESADSVISILLFVVISLQLKYLKEQKNIMSHHTTIYERQKSIMEKQVGISGIQGDLMAVQARISEKQDDMYKPSLRVFYTRGSKIHYNAKKNKIVLLANLVVLNNSLRNNIITNIEAKIPSYTYYLTRVGFLNETRFIKSDDMLEIRNLELDLTTDMSFRLDSTLPDIKKQAEEIEVEVTDMHNERYLVTLFNLAHTPELYQYFHDQNRL